MNTTAAAAQASVTVATVRAWCRIGAVAAIKHAGRWVIDSVSLAARIEIGRMKRPARPVVFSTEAMIAIGGNRWTKAGHDRVYLNDWPAFAGIETSRYNTGNIASASYQGEHVSNSQAAKLLDCIDKVWFDAADGRLHARWGLGESRVASRQDVWAAVTAGVRAAIAAL